MNGVIAYVDMKQIRHTEGVWDISYGFHKTLEIARLWRAKNQASSWDMVDLSKN